jgi:hypothetical protein
MDPCSLANVALFDGADLRSTETGRVRIVFAKNNLVRKNDQEPEISDREPTRTRCPPVTNDPIIVKRIVRVWFSDFEERSRNPSRGPVKSLSCFESVPVGGVVTSSTRLLRLRIIRWLGLFLRFVVPGDGLSYTREVDLVRTRAGELAFGVAERW